MVRASLNASARVVPFIIIKTRHVSLFQYVHYERYVIIFRILGSGKRPSTTQVLAIVGELPAKLAHYFKFILINAVFDNSFKVKIQTKLQNMKLMLTFGISD